LEVVTMPIPRRIRTVLLAAILVSGCTAAGSPRPSTPSSPPPVTKATTQHDIRVTLALEGPPVSAARSFISATVENLGTRAVRWRGGGCDDPVGTWIDVTGAFAPGREWSGLLGRFKSQALDEGPNPNQGSYEAESRLTEPGQIQIACPASLRVNQLEPRGVLRIRAAWGGMIGDQVPAPAGPAVVTTSFPYIGVAGMVPNERTDADPISVRIETRVQPSPAASSSGGRASGPDPLAPALVIDAALADPQFAAWVKAAPEATWINPHVVLLDGRWHIGLFVTGANELETFGEVTVAPDGSITGHRFEP
jgi:hypothetical protein